MQGKARGFGGSASVGFQQAARSAQQFGHASVTSVQAASGALRELNGDFTNNIRAVERFITTIPGVGNALKAVYPAVGGIAVFGVLFEAYKRVSEFIAKVQAVPGAINKGFSEIHSAAQLANDSLALTNDRLADEIAKLEHRPTNSLQTALDEARESADKLSDSLGKDIAKTNELLQKNNVDIWGKLLGQGDTAQSTKLVTDTQGKLDAKRTEYQQTIDYATDHGATPENIQAIKASEMAALQQIYGAAHAAARQQLRAAQDSMDLYQRKQFGMGSDQTANINILGGFDRQMSDEEKMLGQSYLEDTQKSTLRPLQDAANSHKGNDRESEQRLRDAQEQLNAEKLQHTMTLKEEFDFWDARRNLFTAGSEAYNQVVAKQAALAEEGAKQASERIKRYLDEQKPLARELANAMAEANKGVSGMARDRYNASADRNDASNQLAAVQQSITAKLEEQAAEDAAGKTMTRAAAAAQIAAIHTREYGAELDRLIAKQKQIASDPYLSDSEKAKQLGTFSEQQLTLEGNRQIQIGQDTNRTAAPDSSALVGASDALQEFIRSTQDAAKNVQEFFNSALSEINKTIVTDLTSRSHQGPRYLWTNLGRGLATDVTGSALKKGEGSLMSLIPGLGTGKQQQLGSSAANALWTRSSDALRAAIGGGATSDSLMSPSLFKAMSSGIKLPNLAQAGDSDSSDDGDGAAGGILGNASSSAKSPSSPAGGLISTLLPMIPGFARGGDYPANSLIMVGEQGPEIMATGMAGSIIPNHRLASAGGDTHHYDIDVDARGSTNPAEVDARVRQGISEATPHIVAHTMKASQSRNARTAPTARR